MKVEESLNVTFDESPPLPKTSPLEDDDLVKKYDIKISEKKPLGNDVEDEVLENDKIINIKESKKPKNVGEALKDESKVFRNKLNENGVVSRNKARLVAQGYNQQEGIDYDETYALVARLESIRNLLAYADSKPMKTPMSSDTKLTRDEEGESVDNTEYRGMIGSLLYLTASRPDIMFSICLCARFQEDPKTSYLKAKQTALAISTTEAEYVSAGKACQQALWMKQALIDYDIRLDDTPIMCDNKGAIDLSKNPVQHSRTKHSKIRTISFATTFKKETCLSK
ncbi:retrovirus-related pol polyprotein from transposon TNT 1-94 [Tanacetum coccineum]